MENAVGDLGIANPDVSLGSLHGDRSPEPISGLPACARRVLVCLSIGCILWHHFKCQSSLGNHSCANKMPGTKKGLDKHLLMRKNMNHLMLR